MNFFSKSLFQVLYFYAAQTNLNISWSRMLESHSFTVGQFAAQLHCLLQAFAILHCFGTKNVPSSHRQYSHVSSSGAALHLRGESSDISCSEETRHWYVLSNYIPAACAEELKHARKGHCPGDPDLPIKTSSDNAVYLRRHMTLHRYCLPSLHWESKDNISLAESKGKMKNCHFQRVESPQVSG